MSDDKPADNPEEELSEDELDSVSGGLKIKMKKIMITSYQTGGSASGDSFSFGVEREMKESGE